MSTTSKHTKRKSRATNVAGRPVPVSLRRSGFTQRPVLFVHGLWLHAASWHEWVRYFRAAGFAATAPGWPDFPDTVEQTREYPEFMYDQTIDQVVEHYANIIRAMPVRPVAIGHSFGGLVVQRLLDRRLVAAAIAIDPAPIRGVFWLPFAQLRAALPILSRPFSMHGAISLKPRQFRYGFANTLSEEEAAELYELWTIPAPAKPLWLAATAIFNPHAQTKVNVRKSRAPLLLMSGTADHTVPPETTESVQQLYRKSTAVTDLKQWPDRGHSLAIDSGWRELADYSLEWLRRRKIS